MSEQKLPEELLREVLAYRFAISRESFCGFPTRFHVPLAVMDRAERPYACQGLLLVSKRWLRVGSPLLYESVVLRTSSHTRTVATLIRQNPNLGRAVRQLKLFGGYGRDLHAVITAAPNLETVYLNMSMKSSDSLAGIKKAFSIMKPTRLYIEDRPARRNKKSIELYNLLAENMGKWSSLKYVHYNPHYHLYTPMIMALKEAPVLEEIWVDALSLLAVIDDDDRLVRDLLQTSCIQKVHCLGTRFREEVLRVMKELEYPEKVKKAMVYEDYAQNGEDDIAPYDPLAWDDSDDDFFELDMTLMPAHMMFMALLLTQMHGH